MTQKRSAHEIEEDAAAWATRLDSNELSVEEEKALDDWLATDIRCVGALARAEAYVQASKKASVFNTERVNKLAVDRYRNSPQSRRQFFRLGAAAVGLGVLGAASYAGMAAANTYRTRKGETRVVSLSDGSIVNLNTQTAIRVDYGSSRRLVHLLEGEALFEVAADSHRPFIVEAGNTKLSSETSSFSVTSLADRPVTVLVRDGVVKLDDKTSTQKGVLLEANTLAEVTLTAKQVYTPVQIQKVSAEQVSDDIAWKMGRIAFRGESLKNAAVEFGRYSDIEIEIDDKSLANERIAGVFQANDPVGFSRTVADSFGLSVEIDQNKIHLSRKKNI